MKSKKLQLEIIEFIRSQIPEEKNMADELSTILNIHKKAVYKRMNAATPLTLEDLGLLAAHFDLPLERIFYPDRKTFNAEFSGFSSHSNSHQYLSSIEKDLLTIRQAKSAEVWHVTIGLPDFYHFYFDELILFQIFNWERLIWNNSEWQERRFSLNISEKKEIIPLAKRIANLYAQIPVLEIWNEYVLDNIFHQILYVAESRLFQKEEDIITLCNCMNKLIEHLKKMATKAQRFPPNGVPSRDAPDFKLYYSDIMNNNIFFWVKIDSKEYVYTVMDNPNFIKTDNTQIVEYVKSAFNRLLQRAVPLGAGGERHRDLFFHKLETRKKYYIEKILRALERRDIPEK